MATRARRDNPFPSQTALPSPSTPHSGRSLKRRRLRNDPGTSKAPTRRQVVPDQPAIDQALTDCQLLSGNNIISCFPTADTVVAQNEWTSFVWNSRRPQLTQTNLVDIFLFHGDSREQLLHFPQIQNPSEQAGQLSAQVNDSWWGTQGANWNGVNTSYPFFWVIISSETTLDSNAIAQSTFTAVQTTYPNSIIAAISSSSAASASAHSASLTATSMSTTSPGALQSPNAHSEFPHWAIAVIVILGFLAIAATCLLAFLIIRRMRRHGPALSSNRGSMASASPMMANVGGPSSPLLAAGVIGRAASVSEEKSRGGHKDETSMMAHDGASTVSRTGSALGGSAGNEGPFNQHDAAIMAKAFRNMLRQPDFQPLHEGDSGDGRDETDEMINRELAEEGRDIRSVRSERGVRVETLSDSGGDHDTVQKHQSGEA